MRDGEGKMTEWILVIIKLLYVTSRAILSTTSVLMLRALNRLTISFKPSSRGCFALNHCW